MGNSWATQSQTNTNERSAKELVCDCNLMWSLIQQMSTRRLCRTHARNEGVFIPVYSDRARRIAATYARFYLETEEHGDPARKGRFYWMALGAFASKTVACSLDDMRVPVIDSVFKGLAKGNLWLFFDISGWHWYYTRFNGSFDTCIAQRDASAYAKPVKDQMQHYPWKDDALARIKNMHEHADIARGFALLKEIEDSENERVRANLQLEHLLAIADHEQRVILQPLIYDDPDFSKWVKRQRLPVINLVSPALQLAFTSACDTKDAQLKSVAPSETRLEEFESRMKWINDAAKRFHGLMQAKVAYMEEQLQAMAGWVEMDQSAQPQHVPVTIP